MHHCRAHVKPLDLCATYGKRWVFPWGYPVPPNGWFIVQKPIEIDDVWEYPYFRKPPFKVRRLGVFETTRQHV